MMVLRSELALSTLDIYELSIKPSIKLRAPTVRVKTQQIRDALSPCALYFPVPVTSYAFLFEPQ
jgi:hypothetical protein